MAPCKSVVNKGPNHRVDAISTMDQEGVDALADTSGAPVARGKNFLACEDVLAVQAYYRASEDPCKGSRQKREDVFKQVGVRYEEIRKNAVSYQVRRIETSSVIAESLKVREIAKVHLQYQVRTGSSVAQRVTKYIIPDYTKFRSILLQVSDMTL
jgi:hypothetical protein